MEDQGKRLLLAVAIVFALLWVWQIVFPTKAPEKKPETDEAAETETTDGTAGAATRADRPDQPVEPTATPGSTPKAEAVAAEPKGPEKIVARDFDGFSLELSSYGAALKSWTLKGEQFEDRRVTPPVPLELVATAEFGGDYYPFQITLGDGELDAMRLAAWEVTAESDREAKFRWRGSDLEITKTYRIDPERYSLELVVQITKTGGAESHQAFRLRTFGFQDPKADVGGGMTQLEREWKAACLVGEDVKTSSAKSLREKPSRRDGDIKWGGFNHSYFLAVAAADQAGSDRLECDSVAVAEVPGAMQVDISYPPMVLKESGSAYQRRFVAYYGPKFMGTMQAASKASELEPNFEESVDLGFLGFLSGPLLWLLTLFQGFLINWGLAIIGLTLVVKLLVLPWTHKSIKSMKAMTKLRPQMEKLREKYKDDKQRQQVEMMNLFKTHGVNPLSGCLPMLLQMPIWFALYRMLMAAAELYQAPFIPGWIDDLTAPDPVYVLPILVTILMFFQTRLTPTTASGTQQKVIMYGMPIMFGVFSIFFPAGLTLYIFTNTCLTLVHHFFVHREDRIKNRADKARKAARVAAGQPEEEDEDDGDALTDDDSDGGDADDEAGAHTEPKSRQKRSTGGGSRRRGRGGKKGKKKKKKSGPR